MDRRNFFIFIGFIVLALASLFLYIKISGLNPRDIFSLVFHHQKAALIGESCNAHSDCEPQGTICNSGTCAWCQDNSDCVVNYGEAYLCDMGLCTDNCTTDNDCINRGLSGYWCNRNSNCVNSCADGVNSFECPAGAPICDNNSCYAGNCFDNNNCSGQICEGHSCRICTSSYECAGIFGQTFWCSAGGSCREGNSCTINSECEYGSWCGQDLTCHNMGCTEDNDCEVNAKCVAGTCNSLVCTPGVVGESYCQAFGASWWCSQAELCFDGSSSCSQDLDCRVGSICDNGTCYVGNCLDSTYCSGFACVSHNCNTSCSQNSDCDQLNNYNCASSNLCKPFSIWNGLTSSNWHLDSNWDNVSYNGNDSNYIITIDSYINSPVISSNAGAYELQIGNDYLLTVNNNSTLTVATKISVYGSGALIGHLLNNGTVSTSTMSLVGGQYTNNGITNISSSLSISDGGRFINNGTVNCPTGQLWSGINEATNGCYSLSCENTGYCTATFGGSYWCGQDLACHATCSENNDCETDYVCDSGSCIADTICGNSIIEDLETCDDGNTQSLDGCSATCEKESGFTCIGNPSVCQKCANGIVEGTEACDDNNSINGDGCSMNCDIELNYTCSGNPSICRIPGGGSFAGSFNSGSNTLTDVGGASNNLGNNSNPEVVISGGATYKKEEIKVYSEDIIDEVKNNIEKNLKDAKQSENQENKSMIIQILEKMLESLKKLLNIISFDGIVNFV